jgi:hypothetical protein
VSKKCNSTLPITGSACASSFAASSVWWRPPNLIATAGPRSAAGTIEYLRTDFATSRYADPREAGTSTGDSSQTYQLVFTASTLQENIYYLNNYPNRS